MEGVKGLNLEVDPSHRLEKTSLLWRGRLTRPVHFLSFQAATRRAVDAAAPHYTSSGRCIRDPPGAQVVKDRIAGD